MRSQCIPELTKEIWESTATGFWEKANFPNCLGAVDGKHIRIIKPEDSGSMWFNYKEYFSIVLMAVADANYRFLFVDIGSYGKDSDSTIFRNSTLWKRIEENKVDLPVAKPLPGTNDIPIPYFFVGDEAFPLHEHLLKPYRGQQISFKKKVFNYRLCRARRYVECAFGILTNKWRIFHRPLNVNMNLAVDIVKACMVLHNFVRNRDGYNCEDTLTVVGLEEKDTEANIRGSKKANIVRNDVATYFFSEAGQLKWQMSKV